MTTDQLRQTKTGGRDATTGQICGDVALAVGMPKLETPTSWKWTKLTDVARLETGHTPSRKKPEYWGGDIPWIGIRDATSNHGRTIDDTNQHTNELGIANSSARILPANTVCLSRTASVGYVVVMGRPMATSQDFVNWVCSETLDYRFLKYVLLAENRSFLRFASGTTHQTIYFPEVKAFHICLPPLPEQKAIAHILGTLDDKIELNRRMNETLESMARALFKSWFVDFDPVRAKMDGRQPPSSSPTVQELIDKGILQIGDGYRAKRSELGDEGLPFVRAGNLKDHGFDFSNAEILSTKSVESAGEKVSKPLDVAFTSKGTVGRITQVSELTRPFVYSPQICWWRAIETDKLNPDVLYCWMKSREFMDQVSVVKGQTDMADYVSLRDQKRMRITLPDGVAQKKIAPSLKEIHRRLAANLSESETLGQIRDSLLPKLLSGELRTD